MSHPPYRLHATNGLSAAEEGTLRTSGGEARLSARETEVLALAAEGFSNRVIADKLAISANTLKSHLRKTYRRIGVTSRSEAIAWAVEHGVAPLEVAVSDPRKAHSETS